MAELPKNRQIQPAIIKRTKVMFTLSTPGFLSFWDFLTFFLLKKLGFGGLWLGLGVLGSQRCACCSALIYIIALTVTPYPSTECSKAAETWLQDTFARARTRPKG